MPGRSALKPPNLGSAQINLGKEVENGPIIVTLIRFKDLTPTGPVNGLLAEGNKTADKLQGLLDGKQLSDLTELIDDNNANVNVYTKNSGWRNRGTNIRIRLSAIFVNR